MQIKTREKKNQLDEFYCCIAVKNPPFYTECICNLITCCRLSPQKAYEIFKIGFLNTDKNNLCFKHKFMMVPHFVQWNILHRWTSPLFSSNGHIFFMTRLCRGNHTSFPCGSDRLQNYQLRVHRSQMTSDTWEPMLWTYSFICLDGEAPGERLVKSQ